MSKYTDYLNLFKWDPETDGEEEFDIERALNENWDKLDIKIKQHILNTAQTILDFEAQVNQDFQTEKQTLEEDLETYKQTINTDMSTYKEQINDNLSDYKEAIDAEIEEFESNSFATVKMVNDYVSDVYDETSTYSVGDYCIYGNTLYKCTTAITTAEAWNSAHWTVVSVADEINARVKKAGDTMTGDLAMNSNGFYWKESGYGDKFKIIPNFYGADDNNQLKIQGAVGGAGEDPTLQDLITVSAKSGHMTVKGNFAPGKYLKRSKRLGLINLLNNYLGTSVTSGPINLTDSIQYYDILFFQVGAVGAYNFSTCIAMPFITQFGNNDNENLGWRTADTIKLNFFNGSTATYMTLKINSYTQLEIVSNPSNIDIRGIIGLNI